MQHAAPEQGRLGPIDALGVCYTVQELIDCLTRLNRNLEIVSGRNNEKGIALYLNTFVNPADDFLSFTQTNRYGHAEQPRLDDTR